MELFPVFIIGVTLAALGTVALTAYLAFKLFEKT
jgi:hypothetical protein